MKRITDEDIRGMEKVFRLNLINSVTGYKPANLVGTASAEGATNLAIISSVVHMGSNPALIGFILRPTTVERHTYDNILATGCYTINHVHAGFVGEAHYTSAKFPREESEFDTCGFGAEFLDGFGAPYVRESRIKMGLKLLEEVPIKANGTSLLIGTVQSLYLPEDLIAEDGSLDLNGVEDVCISGLDTYHAVRKIAAFEYARVGQGPKHK
ncbi:flavin reductase family protein [Hymenobacter sp. BT491]|uniref:flavin reductase family protein n=1 Tax=Hymenobacter sp. BT491 TaxID=2766779 RepID=UPI001653634F|nr:flavin reductase [Hymenobacter sp. BT491]MBC6989479.1 flavin reductase [Hymenobacter sp. BT491]